MEPVVISDFEQEGFHIGQQSFPSESSCSCGDQSNKSTNFLRIVQPLHYCI